MADILTKTFNAQSNTIVEEVNEYIGSIQKEYRVGKITRGVVGDLYFVDIEVKGKLGQPQAWSFSTAYPASEYKPN